GRNNVQRPTHNPIQRPRAYLLTDIRSVVNPYTRVGSSGRPTLVLTDEALTRRLEVLRVEGHLLLPHHIEALRPATRLAIDCLLAYPESVGVSAALRSLSEASYWSARTPIVKHFGHKVI